MTPAARVAAAIEILDMIGAGQPAEAVLTRWAREHRFAGSGDRVAIRDHVYDVLRCKRSYAWRGGGETGRALMLGAMRAAGQAPETVFDGARFAPAPISAEEVAAGASLDSAPRAVQLDLPDWAVPLFERALGPGLAAYARRMQARAPVFLRVNTGKADIDTALAALADEAIVARPVANMPTALEVTQNPRRIKNAATYRDGLVELQDLGSQMLCDAIPAAPGMRVLDYCAGGGGKALALAAQGAQVYAYDAAPQRMRDLPARAARAGVDIPVLADPASEAPYDVVLCDVPCSGSGTWRRTPEAKWTMTPDRLAALNATQDAILVAATPLVAPGGLLAYATCSVFEEEGADRIAQFLHRHPDWTRASEGPGLLLSEGDYFTHLQLMR
ncbi:MAG: RsmB/NOP family class I SAM-dependent RNA methyltransferase [Pseudomonadota bacterium]